MTIVSSDYMVDESQSSVEVCTSLTDIPDGGLECDVVATINTNDGPKASMSLVYLYASAIWLKVQLNSWKHKWLALTRWIQNEIWLIILCS